MPAKSHCQLTVRHYECDPLGHVNHAVYVHYFETGRIDAMAAVGLPFADIIKQGYTVVASDIFVQYKAPAFTNDVLDVQSYITSFRGARMTWQQDLYRATRWRAARLGRSQRRLHPHRRSSGAGAVGHARPARSPLPSRSRLAPAPSPSISTYRRL